jgi:AcrR family transcriptional regulator
VVRRSALETDSEPSLKLGSTRERIEAEALELFYRQGFRTTTMREITSACGLTPAAFYNHFQSKDDLLYFIIMDAFSDLERQVKLATAAERSSRGQLAALIRTMTLWHCSNIHRARVANRESLELPAEMLTKVRERRRTLRITAEKIITTGITKKEFSVSTAPSAAAARVTATAILGIVQSIQDWYLQSATWSPDQLANLFVELVMNMVGAKEA